MKLFGTAQCLAGQLLLQRVLAQGLSATPQGNTWNSSFTLSEEEIQAAEIDNSTAQSLETAIRFEQTNWAGNSAAEDPFYNPPTNSSHLAPGSLLRVEEYTNTTVYNLPPNTALSRILFQSETLNGTAVPASAYILWPWLPRSDLNCVDRLAVVVWAHGLSGAFGECAPSHIRNLWYQYSAPYILALQGYVVVAPDYTGLGVSRYPNGTEIKHTLLTGPAHANDLFYSVEAAQTAFPSLGDHFVVMGHSQGGHAAWAAAQRQAVRPVKGYLGTIAGSPGTDIRRYLQLNPLIGPLLAFLGGQSMETIFPDFHISQWLTEKGIKVMDLMKKIQACNSAFLQVLFLPGMARENWSNESYHFNTFGQITKNGGKPFAGPMLVLQGTGDSQIPVQLVDEAVNETCTLFPDGQLEYVRFEGVEHVPVMYASQRVWLEWIEDRFAGKDNLTKGCVQKTMVPVRPVETYQKQLAFYLQLATEPYMVA